MFFFKLQPGFSQLLSRHINNQAFERDDLALLISYGNPLLPNPFKLVIRSQQAIGDLKRRLSEDGLLNAIPHHLLVIRMDQIVVADLPVVQQVFRRISCELQTPLAHKLHGPILVIAAAVSHAGQIAQQRVELALAFVQVIYGLAVLGGRFAQGFLRLPGSHDVWLEDPQPEQQEDRNQQGQYAIQQVGRTTGWPQQHQTADYLQRKTHRQQHPGTVPPRLGNQAHGDQHSCNLQQCSGNEHHLS